MEPLEVNGDAPQLAGLRCDGLRCIEYRHAGRLVDPANVVHLCFGGTWHRLYFDSGIIFWRPTDFGPESFEAPELDASYTVIDVAAARGLIGLLLSGYEMAPIEGGARVTFSFNGGQHLTFSNIGDVTSYHAV